jgi:peptide/nickel transport system permease protein
VNKSLKTLASLLVSVAITLFGLIVVTFLIGHVMPIDPLIAIVGDNAPQAVVERVRAEMGFDQPLWVQFGIYLAKLLHGDLGMSIATRNPVTADLARTFPATMELATIAILFAAGIGVPLGVLSAVKRGKWIDQLVRVVCIAGHSLPSFVMALLSLLRRARHRAGAGAAGHLVRRSDRSGDGISDH